MDIITSIIKNCLIKARSKKAYGIGRILIVTCFNVKIEICRMILLRNPNYFLLNSTLLRCFTTMMQDTQIGFWERAKK